MISVFSKDTGLCVGNLSSNDPQIEIQFKDQFDASTHHFYDGVINEDTSLKSYDGVTLTDRADKAAYLADQKAIADARRVEQLVEQKNSEAEASFVNEIATIKGTYSQSEIDGWDIQKQEAEAYQLDSNAPTPTISAIATASGETVADLVTKIMAKVAAYQSAYGTALGKKRKMQNDVTTINESTDNDETKIASLESLTY